MDSFLVRHAAFGDAVFMCGVCSLAYFLRGPSAICALFSLFFHACILGRRRISQLPLYVAVVSTSLFVLQYARTSEGSKGILNTLLSGMLIRIALFVTAAFGFLIDNYILLQFPKVPVRIAGSGACRGVAQASLAVTPGERDALAFTLRIYYPASIINGNRPSRVPYLRDGGAVAAGVARFMRVPSAFFAWMRHIRGWSIEADVVHAPLDIDRARAAAVAAGLITSPSPNASLPVVLFSHGLGGSPDTNAAVIAAFVAVGAVVFAPEHADGSAAFTRVAGEARPYEPLTPLERIDRKAEYARRHGQLKTRAIELSAAGAVASALAALPRHCNTIIRSDANGLVSIKDTTWELLAFILGGQIDRHGYLAAGHSFGGATAITAGSRDTLISAVTALDPWALPLGAPLIARGLPRTPTLALLGEGFAIWPENATALRLMLDARYRLARAAPSSSICLSIADSNGVQKTGRRVHGMGSLFPSPPSTTAAVAVDASSSVGSKIDQDDNDEGSPSSTHAAGTQLHAPPLPPSLSRLAGVHPSSLIISLRDIYHQSFSDYGLLAPRLMRYLKYIGSTRDEKEEVLLINEIIIDYWRHIRSNLTYVPLSKRGGGIASGELLEESRLIDHDSDFIHDGIHEEGQ